MQSGSDAQIMDEVFTVRAGDECGADKLAGAAIRQRITRILLSLPPCLGGAILALLVTGQPISMPVVSEF